MFGGDWIEPTRDNLDALHPLPDDVEPMPPAFTAEGPSASLYDFSALLGVIMTMTDFFKGR